MRKEQKFGDGLRLHDGMRFRHYHVLGYCSRVHEVIDAALVTLCAKSSCSVDDGASKTAFHVDQGL